MRLAIVADIHANHLALEAIVADISRQTPDRVIVAGDFLNRGPRPAEVLQRLQKLGWEMMRGNHEDYVIQQSMPAQSIDDTELAAFRPAQWTARQVPQSINWLKSLPIALTIESGDEDCFVVAHGSPRSNAEGFFPRTTQERGQEMLEGKDLALLCCGHTHVPLLRQFGRTQVFNVGSVGFPFDGDQRAAYGIVDWSKPGKWTTELRRITYPVDQLLKDFDQFQQAAGPISGIIRRELESARPHLNLFTGWLVPQVRRGEISMEQAVQIYVNQSSSELESRYRQLRRSCHQPSSEKMAN